MSWWFFGSTNKKHPPPSEFDAAVPPPPGGAILPPPEVPKSLRSSSPTEFKGFTPPPLTSIPQKEATKSQSSLFSSLFNNLKTTDDYTSEDYSKYTSPVQESSGVFDSQYIQHDPSVGFVDKTRNCLESIKMGMKMGATVGAIFGGLTGLYAGVVHRSVLLFPISIVGGGISFGFFLGCGMLVRCDDTQQLSRIGDYKIIKKEF